MTKKTSILNTFYRILHNLKVIFSANLWSRIWRVTACYNPHLGCILAWGEQFWSRLLRPPCLSDPLGSNHSALRCKRKLQSKLLSEIHVIKPSEATRKTLLWENLWKFGSLFWWLILQNHRTSVVSNRTCDTSGAAPQSLAIF